MSSLNPPNSDELIPRHQFYSSMVGKTNSNAKDIDGVAKKLADVTHDFEAVRDDVKTTSIRNKTLIAAGIVIWSVIGSSVGLYIQRGLTTFDDAKTQLEVLEKRIKILEEYIDVHKKKGVG